MSRSVPTFLAALAWLAGCGGDDGATGSVEADAARADDGGLCEPFASTVCSDGDAYWQDSCGNRQVIVEECVAPRTCVEERGRCCSPPGPEAVYSGVPIFARINWEWPANSASEIRYRYVITELDFQAGAKGQAIRTNAQIDGENVRFGPMTHRETAMGTGTGLGFSCYIGVEDAARAELGTTAELDVKSDQGGLLVIGMLLDFGVGSTLDFRIAREEQRGAQTQDWFAHYVAVDDGDEVLVGRCAFSRENAASPAVMRDAGTMFSRVNRAEPDEFSTATLPRFGARVAVPTYDGEPATGATLNYPGVGMNDEPYPNVDVTWDPDAEEVVISQGMGVGQCGLPGRLF